jgi:hypothetical protein
MVVVEGILVRNGWNGVNLCTDHAKQIDLFLTLITGRLFEEKPPTARTDLSVWHEYHTFIAFSSTDVGKANTGVAGCSFNDCATWIKSDIRSLSRLYCTTLLRLTALSLQHPGLRPAQLCL